MSMRGGKKQNKNTRVPTSTSAFLHELVDEDGNADSMDSLRSHKQVVMISHHESQEHQQHNS